MKRVFLYVRVSTEEQAIHGLSIGAQTKALEDWAKSNDHKIVGTYIDAGISARKPASKRPGLQKLLLDIKARKGDLIVFTKLDRWFRNIAEYYKVQEVLEQYKVNWMTIQEDYDTASASGRLKVNIMLSVAQDEADRTSERIKAINKMKREKLEAVTGEAPLGYKIEGKKFIKDPDTKDAVDSFFKTFLATGSISAARQYVSDHYGIRLQYQRAHKMLDKPYYYGRYFDTDGMTPPYITKEQYEKIQSMRRRIVRKTAHNRTYLFSGLIFCGECGQRMGARVNTVGEIYFYNCTSHYQKMSDCKNNVNLSEKRIERFIMETIHGEMAKRRLQAEKLKTEQKERDYQREIAVLQSKIGKLKDLYLNDLISLEEYKKDREDYSNRIEKISKEECAQKIPNFEIADELLKDGWETVYENLTREKKREFWRLLIKEIKIFHDRHIEYNLYE